MIMVSSCLIGEKCRYDGGEKKCERIIKELDGREYVPFCPEVMGGMDTPRHPCEIIGGDGNDVLDGKARVISSIGEDCTTYYLLGAQLTLDMAMRLKPEKIILKAKSPSCGAGSVYDGSFKSVLKEGCGVTAALLMRSGFNVETE